MALFLLLATSAHSLDIEGFEPDSTVIYKTIGDTELPVHQFFPPGHRSSDMRPAVVFFYGGGWAGGSPSQFYPQCEHLAARGFVAMSADYRVTDRDGTTPQECVTDAKSMIRWIRENADQFGIDPDRIVAGGGSAGGHIAAATGTLSGYEEEGEDLNVSSIPNALILFNPVYDNGPDGYAFDTVEDYWEGFSPLHNISVTTPPTATFLGTNDKFIPVETAEEYKSLMEAEGVRSDLYLYEDQTHGFFNYTRPEGYRPSIDDMDSFLESLGYYDPDEFWERSERTAVHVDSLEGLVAQLGESNIDLTMEPGTYLIDASNTKTISADQALLKITGSGSYFDFTGVTIEVNREVFSLYGNVSVTKLEIWGEYNVVKNLTLLDVGGSNPRRGAMGGQLDGNYNRLEGVHFTMAGSSPYGYGDLFGKGSGYVIKPLKHAALLVRGIGNHVKDSTFIMRAYGHGIFCQGSVDALIEGCYVEGETAYTDDILAEEGTGSAADNVDFMSVLGYKVPAGRALSMQEDGIRAYNSGNLFDIHGVRVLNTDGTEADRRTSGLTVIDCEVVRMRSGVTVGLASGDRYVENCTAIETEEGFWVGSGGRIIGCSGDASVGPLLGTAYERDSNNLVDLTVLDPQTEVFNTMVAYIAGSDHNITFRSENENPDESLKIMVSGVHEGYRFLEANERNYASSNITINNLTHHPLVLAENSSNITYESLGSVTDDSVFIPDVIPCSNLSAFSEIQAEGDCESFGVEAEDTADEGLGKHVGFIENGDWIKFEGIRFNRGAASIEARISSNGVGGNIEVRLGASDGPLMGTLVIEPTGNWNTWVTVSGELDEEIEGTEDVVLVFAGEPGYLFNLNWFRFGQSEDGENYAMSGAATQSSVDYEGAPERAIDGDTNGLWGGSSVTHTASEENAWWEVDLGENRFIGDVVVYPRTDDCCTARLTFFTVSVLDGDRNVVFTESFTEAVLGPLFINTNGVDGRIVRVALDEQNPLSLAEVEVYAFVEVDTDGDGISDIDDPDDDNDGVDDGDDAFPLDPNETLDTDKDGVGDNSEIVGAFINISTRGYVADGAGILIGGIVITGTDSMLLLVQGVGSELVGEPYNMGGDALLDTEISIYQGEVEVASNDDWDSDSALAVEIEDAALLTGATVLGRGSMSSGILIDLDPGIYTVLLKGNNASTGVGFVEVYNVSTKIDSN